MKLTDAFIRSLRFEGTKTKHFDDGLPNFGVRVYSTGVRFIVMLGNERRMKTLGKYPDMSLKDARREALAILTDKTPQNTTTHATDAISAFLAAKSHTARERTVSDYRRLLTRHFPKQTLDHLDRLQLQITLNRLASTPAEQNHAHTAFSVFLNWCITQGYINHNPLAGLRSQGKIQKRDRVLSDTELKAVWDNATTHPFGTIVRICIATGLRRGEATKIQPEWITENSLTIPSHETKNHHEHRLYLPPFTADLFTDLPLTFNGWSKAKGKLDKDSGVKGWTIHDLRRTFATNHAKLGTLIHITELLLNHQSGTLGGIVGVYQRYDYEKEMMDACERYDKWLRSLCS